MLTLNFQRSFQNYMRCMSWHVTSRWDCLVQPHEVLMVVGSTNLKNNKYYKLQQIRRNFIDVFLFNKKVPIQNFNLNLNKIIFTISVNTVPSYPACISPVQGKMKKTQNSYQMSDHLHKGHKSPPERSLSTYMQSWM